MNLIYLACANTDMLIDADIMAAGDNVKGTLVIERIKCQFPENCDFKSAGSKIAVWRIPPMSAAQSMVVDIDNDEGSTPAAMKMNASNKINCACIPHPDRTGHRIVEIIIL